MRKLTIIIFAMFTEKREWKYNNPGMTENKLSRLEEI